MARYPVILSTVLVIRSTDLVAAAPGNELADGSGVSCHDALVFRVAMRDRTDGLVTDVVVTPSPQAAVPLSCDMAVGSGAYRMVDVGASCLALGDRFLALDVGTGPEAPDLRPCLARSCSTQHTTTAGSRRRAPASCS